MCFFYTKVAEHPAPLPSPRLCSGPGLPFLGAHLLGSSNCELEWFNHCTRPAPGGTLLPTPEAPLHTPRPPAALTLGLRDCHHREAGKEGMGGTVELLLSCGYAPGLLCVHSGGPVSHQLRAFPQQPPQPQGITGFCLLPRCLFSIGSGSRIQVRKGWYLLALEPQDFPEHCSPTQAFIFYRLPPC